MANDADLRIGWEDGQLRTGVEASVAAVQGSVARMEALFAGLGKQMQASMEQTAVAANQMAAATEAGAGQLPGALGGIQAKLESITSGLSRHLEPVIGIFTRLNFVMAGAGAALAGGKAFGAAIDEAKQLAGESLHLSRALGITAAEASVLNLALGDIYSSADDYLAVFQHFARKIKENEEEMRAMGLQTRDAAGHLRDANEVFRESYNVLGHYRAGLDQNMAAQAMYGKSVDDAMKLQKLTNQGMDEAREKAKALGLVLTAEGAESVTEYKAAMNDAGDVLSALKNTIGQALMPVLAQLAEWFATLGPYAVTAIKDAVGGLIAVFWGLREAAMITFQLINAAIIQVAEPIRALGVAFWKVIHGDFAGAKAELANIPKVWDKAWADAGNNIVNSSTHTRDRLLALFSDGTPLAHAAGKSGNKGYAKHEKDKAPADKSRLSEWEAVLAEQKLAIAEQARADGTFHEMSKAEELKYWEGIAALRGKSHEEDIAVRRKVAETALEIRKQAFESELAHLHALESEWGKNSAAKVAIAEREADLVASKYGKESAQYAATQKHLTELALAAAEERRQIDDLARQARERQALAEIDAAQEDAKLLVQLGRMTQDELLTQEAGFETRRSALKQQALMERLSLIDPDRDPVEYAKISAQIEDEEQNHQVRLAQIKRQAILEQTKDMRGMFSSMESGFANVIKGVLSGTLTMTKALRGMVAAVVNAVIGMLAQIAAKWLVTQLMQIATGKATGASTIATKSAEAGAGGVASMAAAPWPYNTTAPIFGEAMASAAAAFGALLSGPGFAVGAWNVPGDMITKVHQGETIMPAEFAERFRDDAGGGATHLHIHAVDGASVERLFRDNGHLLARELRRQARNFAPART